MASISLVPACGGTHGSYLAGASRELSYTIEEHEIALRSVHAFSAGAWTAPYVVTAQRDRQQLGCMEMIWLHKTCGRQLFYFAGPLWLQPILRLQRMSLILGRGELRLNRDALFKSDVLFEIVVTNIHTGEPMYLPLRRRWFFRDLTASAAIPLFHRPVYINNAYGIDGGLADPMPIRRALDRGSRKVLVVTSRAMDDAIGIWTRVAKLAAHLYSNPIRRLITSYYERGLEIEEQFRNDERVFFIRPRASLPSFVDTNVQRVAEMYRRGREDFRSVKRAFVDWAQA